MHYNVTASLFRHLLRILFTNGNPRLGFSLQTPSVLRMLLLDLSELIWTNLGLSVPSWAYVGLSGPIWAYLRLSEPLWASLNLSGPSWANLDPPCPNWSNVGTYGSV